MDFYKHDELTDFIDDNLTFREIYVTKKGFFLKQHNESEGTNYRASNLEDFKYILNKIYDKHPNIDFDSLLKWCNEHKYAEHYAFIVFTFLDKIKGDIAPVVHNLVVNNTLNYLDEIAPQLYPEEMHNMMLPKILQCEESIEKQIIDKLNNVKNKQDMTNIRLLFDQHRDTICFTLLKPTLFYFALKMPSKYLLQKCCNVEYYVHNFDIFEKIIESGIFENYTPHVSLFKTLDLDSPDYHNNTSTIFYRMKKDMLLNLSDITFDGDNTRKIINFCQDFASNNNKGECVRIVLSHIYDKFKNNVHDEINILLRNGLIKKVTNNGINNIVECIIKNINEGNGFWMSYGNYLNEMSCSSYLKTINKLENQEYVDRLLQKFMSDEKNNYEMREVIFGFMRDISYVGTVINALCSNDIFIATAILSPEKNWNFLDFVSENNFNLFFRNSVNVIAMMVQNDSENHVKHFATKYFKTQLNEEGYKSDDWYDAEDETDQERVENETNQERVENETDQERVEGESDVPSLEWLRNFVSGTSKRIYDSIVKACKIFIKAHHYSPEMKYMIIDASIKYDITLFLENYNHCSSGDFDKRNLSSCPNVVGYLISKKMVKQADYLPLIFNNNYHQLLTCLDIHDVQTKNEIVNNKETYYRIAMNSNSIQMIKWLMKHFLTPDLFTWSDIESAFTSNNIAMLNTMIEYGIGLVSLRQNNNRLFKNTFYEGNCDMFIFFMKNNWRLYELEINKDEIAKICLEKCYYGILKYVMEAGLVVTYKTLEPFLPNLIETEKELIVDLYDKRYLTEDDLKPYDSYTFINEIIKNITCGICQELIYADYHTCSHCRNRTHDKCINEWIYCQEMKRCIYCRENIINWLINNIL